MLYTYAFIRVIINIVITESGRHNKFLHCHILKPDFPRLDKEIFPHHNKQKTHTFLNPDHPHA